MTTTIESTTQTAKQEDRNKTTFLIGVSVLVALSLVIVFAGLWWYCRSKSQRVIYRPVEPFEDGSERLLIPTEEEGTAAYEQ